MGASMAASCRHLQAVRLVGEARRKPAIETAESLAERDLRPPAERRRDRPDVGDVPGLIARPPRSEADVWPVTIQLGDVIHHLEQADGVLHPAAQIEDATAEAIDGVE